LLINTITLAAVMWFTKVWHQSVLKALARIGAIIRREGNSGSTG
jgi:hypothetical protein